MMIFGYICNYISTSNIEIHFYRVYMTVISVKVDSSDSFEYIAITLKLLILYITFFYIVYKLILSK